VNDTNGLDGVLSNDEANMTKEAADITTSINALEQQISSEQTQLTNEFTAMETAINSINTEKQVLNDYFSGSSSSPSANSAPTAAGSSVSSG
jgi:flagellar capping protein FliD